MARVDHVAGWETSLAPAEVFQIIARLFAMRRVHVVEQTEQRIAGQQGSQFRTRLLGGWFVNPEAFPKRFEIDCRPSTAGCQINLRIEETLGFGFLDGQFKSRYRSYFVEFEAALMHELPPAAVEVVDAEVVSDEIVSAEMIEAEPGEADESVS